MSEQNKTNNKSLCSGERHVRSTLDKVKKGVLMRYKEALKYVTDRNEILDLGCGVGYGCYILSEKAKRVVGIDDSQETINYAKKHWSRKNVEYQCKDVFEVKGKYDTVVALEIIEHIRDTKELFKKLSEVAKDMLILSVPHTSRVIKKTASNFHWKHFTEEEIINCLIYAGFKVEKIETLKTKNVFCVARKKRT